MSKCHNEGCSFPEGECNHDCDQGRTCPARRVRAGRPPPADLPIQFAGDEPDDEKAMHEEFRSLFVRAAWAVAVITTTALALGIYEGF